jgi:hypothetical protein
MPRGPAGPLFIAMGCLVRSRFFNTYALWSLLSAAAHESIRVQEYTG